MLEIDATLERMIWRIVSRYGELRGAPVETPPGVTYALFDGMFQRALLHHIAGDAGATDELRRGATDLIVRLVPA